MTTAASAARTRRTMVRARADRGCPPPRRRSAVERWLRDARAGSRDRRAGGTRGTAGARRPAAILLAATARRGDAGGCAGRDGGALRARRDAPARRGARLRLVDGGHARAVGRRRELLPAYPRGRRRGALVRAHP